MLASLTTTSVVTYAGQVFSQIDTVLYTGIGFLVASGVVGFAFRIIRRSAR